MRSILREFIRENLGVMFGLDRRVTMNALANTISGPSIIDAWAALQDDKPVTSYRLAMAGEPVGTSATDHLGQPDVTDDVIDSDDVQEDI